jgi:hypothetical protein
MTTPILKFKDDYEYLSNFYTRPKLLIWRGVEFDHSEGPYQLEKDQELANNPDFVREFALYSASETKKWGKHHARLRADWNSVKVSIMHEIVKKKFDSNLDLKLKLIATGSSELIEGNWWHDNFWGTCPVGSKNGRNELGKIHMRIRTEFTGHELGGIIRY